MNYPFVSAVIPVYNRERFLGLAVESIRQQNYPSLEIIVVDDGSTDGTAAVAKTYPEIRYICQKHQGVAAARNTGINSARGELIAFLDSDDLWTQDKLQSQIPYLIQHPEVDYIVAKMENFVDSANPDAAWMEPSAFEKRTLGIQTLVARRDVFDRVGMFDTSYEVGEDIDWFLRAADYGLVRAELNDILLLRRIHEANLCRRPIDEQARVMTRILQASVERKRRQRHQERVV